jgi:hypothetical protein
MKLRYNILHPVISSCCISSKAQSDGIVAAAHEPAPRTQSRHMHSGSTDDASYDASEAARRKICSGCAVEEVTDTGAEIVRCLDCVRGAGLYA